jgi:hypothetical protein
MIFPRFAQEKPIPRNFGRQARKPNRFGSTCRNAGSAKLTFTTAVLLSCQAFAGSVSLKFERTQLKTKARQKTPKTTGTT